MASRKWFASAVAFGTVGGTVLWAQPTYKEIPTPHAGFQDKDQAVLRTVQDQSLSAKFNPGIRAFPDLITPKEASALLQELQPIMERYGLSLISPQHAALYRFQQSYLGPHAPPVNMLRVTGRPEAQEQRPAPWGYGDNFNEAALPPRLKALVEKVRSQPGVKLGPLRDITLNYRHSGFLRLDPHLDPAGDGPDVFIIGLDSDTVLTFSPCRALKLMQWWDTLRSALTLEDERESVARAADSSWTPWDIDVLARARSMIHFSGDARYLWTHGTRLGVLPPVQEGADSLQGNPQAGSSGTSGRGSRQGQGTGRAERAKLCDWWGSREHLVPRGLERTSIVLAFGPAEELAGSGSTGKPG